MSGLLIRFVNPPYAHDYFAYESVVLQEDWAVLCITDPVIWPSEAGDWLSAIEGGLMDTHRAVVSSCLTMFIHGGEPTRV